MKERLCRAVDGVIVRQAHDGFSKNSQNVDHLFLVNGIAKICRIEGTKTWIMGKIKGLTEKR